MGFDLRIGEAFIIYNQETVKIDCAIIKRNDAPAYDEPTDYENQRQATYTAWSDAMEALGLHYVMFGSRNDSADYIDGADYIELSGKQRYPLISNHPGVAPITKEHVQEVERCLAAYKLKHPDHIAQYPPLKEGIEQNEQGFYAAADYVNDPRYDSVLCCGEWLAYWMRWAIDSCSRPVFVNS